MGIVNTKDWQTRIDEVFTTLAAVGGKPDSLIEIRRQLTALSPFEQRMLSQSLHLNLPWGSADQAKRRLLRAVTFLEVLLFDVPAAIVSRYLHETPHALEARLGALLGALDVPAEGRPDLGKHRPLRPGVSISGGEHPGPGSIGCFVVCNRTGRHMLLSNEHVLRAEFGIQRLDEHPLVRQPAKLNAGMAHDRVAEYARGLLDPRIDAAVAVLDPQVKGFNRLPDGTVLRHVPGPMPTGEPVYKWGAASGRTMGWLGAAVDASVPHAKFSHDPIHFRGQLQITPRIDALTRKPVPFQVPGDSGSILYDGSGRILGLLHGGAAGGLGALATPIDRVFELLDVRFDPVA